MPEALLPLDAIDPADRRFGGKAAGLARLLCAGAVVPYGFAVAADTVPPSRWGPDLRERIDAGCRDALRAPVRGALVGARGGSARSILRRPLHHLPRRRVTRSRTRGGRALHRIGRKRSGSRLRRLGSTARGRPRRAAHGGSARGRCSVHARSQWRRRRDGARSGGRARRNARRRPARTPNGQDLSQRARLLGNPAGASRRRGGDASARRDYEVEQLATVAARLAVDLGEPLDLEWAIPDSGLADACDVADATGAGAASIVSATGPPHHHPRRSTTVDHRAQATPRPTTVRSRCGRTGTCARRCRSRSTHSPGRCGARPSFLPHRALLRRPPSVADLRRGRGRWIASRVASTSTSTRRSRSRCWGPPAHDAPSRRLPRRRGDRRPDRARRAHAAPPARRGG